MFMNRSNKRDLPKLTEEYSFLAGPRSRLRELYFTLKVFWNFVRGFRTMHFIGPCVTVFGSARTESSDPFYQKAEQIGTAIAKMGFTVMTGGGPGIMEAANKGAYMAGGYSVGCKIILPKEQEPNPYLHKWINIPYFFIRKVLLVKYSYAFIVMPGGFGTMDEFFESLLLVQTKMIEEFPVILFGKEYHKELVEHIELMKTNEMISESELSSLFITDSVEEVVDYLETYSVKKHGLKKVFFRRKWWLWEQNHTKDKFITK